MIERRLPHLDDFTIHTGLEHAIAVQSTAKMPNLPAQLPVLLLQRKNMRDACEIDTLVLAQLLRLRKTRHVTKRVAPRTTLRALRHHQTKAVVLTQRLWMHARNLRRLIEKEIENPLATAIVTGDKPLMGAHLSAEDGKVKLDTI